MSIHCLTGHLGCDGTPQPTCKEAEPEAAKGDRAIFMNSFEILPAELMTETPRQLDADPSKRIVLVVHQETSDPGLIAQKLRSRGYELEIICPALEQPLPTRAEDYEGAVIFGGPMSANDDETLPFIRAELDWIPQVLAAGKPFLGVCLGAQLLARVLGAKVSPHPEDLREIGYYPLTPTSAGTAYFNQPMHVYHWHKEGFELPSGSTLLASGETFANQAFRYGESAYGVQFHPEMTDSIMQQWLEKAADQLVLPGAQPQDQHFQNHAQYSALVAQWLDRFLDRWLAPQTADLSKV